MFKKLSLFLSLVLLSVLTGCTAKNRIETQWPKPRPLGGELSSYRPPENPVIHISKEDDIEPASLEEPTGMMTLRQALALALMKNPELAVFSWDVRVGEARTLQAGLLPNPQIDHRSGRFRGNRRKRGI